MMPAPPSTPKWMIVLIVIILLPVFQFPFLLSDCPDIPIVRTLLWIYPFYCLVAAYLAYQCYPQRHALARSHTETCDIIIRSRRIQARA